MEACFAFKCMSSNSEDCIQAYAFDPTKIGASPIDFSQVFDIALPFDLRPSYHTSGEVIDGVTDSSGATYTYTIASQKRKCTFTDSFGNARTEYQFITPLYIVATQSATPPYTTGTFFWAKNMGKSVGPTWGTGGSLTTQWQCCHEGKEWAWDPAITS